MGLLLLIPGIILMETDGWFEDQQTVGEILAWSGGILLALQILFFTLAAAGVWKASRDTRRW